MILYYINGHSIVSHQHKPNCLQSHSKTFPKVLPKLCLDKFEISNIENGKPTCKV